MVANVGITEAAGFAASLFSANERRESTAIQLEGNEPRQRDKHYK
jgi:hypothetical protein